jgi:hypothetical protein
MTFNSSTEECQWATVTMTDLNALRVQVQVMEARAPRAWPVPIQKTLDRAENVLVRAENVLVRVESGMAAVNVVLRVMTLAAPTGLSMRIRVVRLIQIENVARSFLTRSSKKTSKWVYARS